MLKSVVVATDASPSSNRAVEMAAHLASVDGAALCVLYVVRDMQIPSELMKMAEVEKIAGDRDDVMGFVAKKVLKDAQARAQREGAENVQTVEGRGDPATVIMEIAEQRSADLIVMGTRGLGKMKTVLLGSVSRKVSNLCDASCLIIK